MVLLAFWFVVGRVIFVIGYVVYFVTGISPLRSIGFTVNVFTNACMIAQIMQHPVMQYLPTD